jgi:hypothetical protein
MAALEHFKTHLDSGTPFISAPAGDINFMSSAVGFLACVTPVKTSFVPVDSGMFACSLNVTKFETLCTLCSSVALTSLRDASSPPPSTSPFSITGANWNFDSGVYLIEIVGSKIDLHAWGSFPSHSCRVRVVGLRNVNEKVCVYVRDSIVWVSVCVYVCVCPTIAHTAKHHKLTLINSTQSQQKHS